MGVEKIIKMYEAAITEDISSYKDPERPDLNLVWLTGRLDKHYSDFHNLYGSGNGTREIFKEFDEMFNRYEKYLKSEHY